MTIGDQSYTLINSGSSNLTYSDPYHDMLKVDATNPLPVLSISGGLNVGDVGGTGNTVINSQFTDINSNCTISNCTISDRLYLGANQIDVSTQIEMLRGQMLKLQAELDIIRADSLAILRSKVNNFSLA